MGMPGVGSAIALLARHPKLPDQDAEEFLALGLGPNGAKECEWVLRNKYPDLYEKLVLPMIDGAEKYRPPHKLLAIGIGELGTSASVPGMERLLGFMNDPKARIRDPDAKNAVAAALEKLKKRVAANGNQPVGTSAD